MTTIHHIAATTSLRTLDTAISEDEFEVVVSVSQDSAFYRRSAVALLASLVYMGIGRTGGNDGIIVEQERDALIVRTSGVRWNAYATAVVQNAVEAFRILSLGAK